MSQDRVKKIEEVTTGVLASSGIAFAVHEVSKTLASPGDADLRRLRRLGRYLLGTQKLGIMIRKSHDPVHLDAFTDADWS